MHSLYLMDYPGGRLIARCVRCKRMETYATDDLLRRLGNRQLRGLKTTIGDMWHCPRLTVIGWDECRLKISAEDKKVAKPTSIWSPDLRRLGAGAVHPTVTLGDLREWDALYGVCRCGRIYFVSHKDLRKRFGPEATIAELQTRLRCRASRDHREVMFALARERR